MLPHQDVLKITLHITQAIASMLNVILHCVEHTTLSNHYDMCFTNGVQSLYCPS